MRGEMDERDLWAGWEREAAAWDARAAAEPEPVGRWVPEVGDRIFPDYEPIEPRVRDDWWLEPEDEPKPKLPAVPMARQEWGERPLWAVAREGEGGRPLTFRERRLIARREQAARLLGIVGTPGPGHRSFCESGSVDWTRKALPAWMGTSFTDAEVKEMAAIARRAQVRAFDKQGPTAPWYDAATRSRENYYRQIIPTPLEWPHVIRARWAVTTTRTWGDVKDKIGELREWAKGKGWL